VTIVRNVRFDQSFESTGGACSSANSGQQYFHVTFNPNGSVSHTVDRQEFRFSPTCTGPLTTVCTTVFRVQVVNGRLVYQTNTQECHEEPA
jgi:hypothetical protein